MVLELLLDVSYKDAYSLDFHKFLRPRALISKNKNIFGGIFQDFPIRVEEKCRNLNLHEFRRKHYDSMYFCLVVHEVGEEF